MALTKPKTKTKPKKPTTLKEYVDQGWEVGPLVKMSNPPVYTLTKDGKSIQFRPPMKQNPFGKRPKTPKEKPPRRQMPKSGLKGLGKRGAEKIKEYLDKKDRTMMPLKKKNGGLAGRLAKRGYGKAMR
tara:strand:- start:59 stop:442 length:384 start_codon:yes stop_codon:yes gene_type:complete